MLRSHSNARTRQGRGGRSSSPGFPPSQNPRDPAPSDSQPSTSRPHSLRNSWPSPSLRGQFMEHCNPWNTAIHGAPQSLEHPSPWNTPIPGTLQSMEHPNPWNTPVHGAPQSLEHRNPWNTAIGAPQSLEHPAAELRGRSSRGPGTPAPASLPSSPPSPALLFSILQAFFQQTNRADWKCCNPPKMFLCRMGVEFGALDHRSHVTSWTAPTAPQAEIHQNSFKSIKFSPSDTPKESNPASNPQPRGSQQGTGTTDRHHPAPLEHREAGMKESLQGHLGRCSNTQHSPSSSPGKVPRESPGLRESLMDTSTPGILDDGHGNPKTLRGTGACRDPTAQEWRGKVHPDPASPDPGIPRAPGARDGTSRAPGTW
ncbi:uncharacterized protein LOC126642912 isoform X2 [Myiozetetes cayanensis]|uniref:uncharacterized protein LOC126642912 isoform X2 n=1 Tax=Myiozetetes cayanensis TaxID=478635 RepID=UPI00215F3698|nr:uncharacterized protein LOC126642912 isoform X2 [Myiozetetes cayanensis]